MYDTLLGSIGACIVLMATVGQISSLALVGISGLALALVGFALFATDVARAPSPNSGQKSQEGEPFGPSPKPRAHASHERV
jgi:hypothetical protein